MVQHVHCSRRRLLGRGVEFHVCTINKSAHTKKVCCWIESEMFSLMSTGLTLLPVKRKGKERASHVSPAFYGARGGVPEQNSISHSHSRTKL